MRIARIALALILTVVMLRIARETSRGHSEPVAHTENGLSFSMNTVPKWDELSQARVEVVFTAPSSIGAVPQLRSARVGIDNSDDLTAYTTVAMTPSDSGVGAFFANVPTGERGGKLLYYIEAAGLAAPVRLLDVEGKPFVLKYIGHVPLVVLVSHIGLMFATVFCVSMGAIYAFSLLRGSGGALSMAKFFMWATLFAFVGGYPFGFAMNWFAFGGIWEGVPFGTDATDNKTQLLLVYLLFLTLATIGTLRGGRNGRDLYSPRTTGLLGMTAFVLMLGIYLIPHSIQFSGALTYAVCYAFIALFAITYLVGWARVRQTPRR